MRRLGYTRYVAQGGDQGAGVTDAMGRQAPDGLLGVHFNFLDAAPRELLMAALNLRLAFSGEDRAQFSKVIAIFMRGYIAEMGEHPQTIGYPLLDSPLGLAAWMLDHDADSYEKISRAFLGGQPSGGLTRDHVLDNITLYWLTSTATSAARLYWETGRGAMAAFKHPPPHVSLPVAYTVFPGETLPGPAPLGEERLPQPHLLQRGRQGRPLRRLGRAAAVLRRDCARRSGHCARPDRSRRPTRSPGLDRVERLEGASHWVHHDAAERVTPAAHRLFRSRSGETERVKIMNTTHWRRARLAAVCCAALAALTLAAAGATAATAGTRTTASGSGGAPIVTTDDGAVRGTTAGTVAEFLGIPYAAPPTGNLRWRPPRRRPAGRASATRPSSGRAARRPARTRSRRPGRSARTACT